MPSIVCDRRIADFGKSRNGSAFVPGPLQQHSVITNSRKAQKRIRVLKSFLLPYSSTEKKYMQLFFCFLNVKFSAIPTKTVYKTSTVTAQVCP